MLKRGRPYTFVSLVNVIGKEPHVVFFTAEAVPLMQDGYYSTTHTVFDPKNIKERVELQPRLKTALVAARVFGHSDLENRHMRLSRWLDKVWIPQFVKSAPILEGEPITANQLLKHISVTARASHFLESTQFMSKQLNSTIPANSFFKQQPSNFLLSVFMPTHFDCNKGLIIKLYPVLVSGKASSSAEAVPPMLYIHVDFPLMLGAVTSGGFFLTAPLEDLRRVKKALNDSSYAGTLELGRNAGYCIFLQFNACEDSTPRTCRFFLNANKAEALLVSRLVGKLFLAALIQTLELLPQNRLNPVNYPICVKSSAGGLPTLATPLQHSDRLLKDVIHQPPELRRILR